jgi:ABC-type polysaccharide/polyol phosphate export permease
MQLTPGDPAGRTAGHGVLGVAVTDVLAYRELLATLVRRELTLRYRYAPLGVAWALLMPLLTTVIFSVVFTRVVDLEVGIAYPLFAYSGLLVWYFSATAIRNASTSLSSQASLITKVYFPRELLPFSSVLTAFADFLVGGLFLVALLIGYGVRPTWALLVLPLVIGVQCVFTAGLALLVSMGSLLYRDLRHLLEVVLTLWMYATAVLYPVDRIGGPIGALLEANPMTVIVESYRDVLIRGRLPAPIPFTLVALLACGTLAGGWMLFRREEGSFAERI